ncbi:MAG: TolC family protein [Flavobacteriales bacterium]|nr:TolC family protein [Flavobacteriales bacterium]
MRSIPTLLGILLVVALRAQGPMSLSMQQAMDMAATQSYMTRNSALAVEVARHRTKEFTAIGLPQINGEVSMSNFIDPPTSLVPNFFTPGVGPEYIAASFQVPWQLSAGGTISQLIFDGSYLIGLRASKELRLQSEQDRVKAQADARAQAAKAYQGVLAAEEGARLLGEGVPLLEKSLRDATAMQQQGFLETTDVDRLTIDLEALKNQQRSFLKQGEIARAMLALTLGLPQGTPIMLTDKLDVLIDNPEEAALSEQGFDPNSHVELDVANTYARLQVLNMKNERSKGLPSLGGFFSHQQVWNGPEFDPGGKYPFYPTTLWGLKLTVPIFSSGMRHHKVQQAKLGLEQAEINRTATEQRLLATAEQQRLTARSAFDNYTTEKRNMELSRSIMERTSTKFTSGLATSFELTQEQGRYLSAQQAYVQRLIDLLIARTELRKALDLY